MASLLNGLNFVSLVQEQTSGSHVIRKADIYHHGWIDLNKNGKLDVYENRQANIEKRINDLLSEMTLWETCRAASFGRRCHDGFVDGRSIQRLAILL